MMFIFIFLFQIDDKAIFLAAEIFTIPVANIKLPFMHFAVFAPTIFLVLHYHMLYNFYEHSRLLSKWRYHPKNSFAVNKDTLIPFILNTKYKYLDEQGAFSLDINKGFLFNKAILLDAFIGVIFALFPLVVFFQFFFIFSKYQSFLLTSLHFMCLLLCFVFLWIYWPLINHPVLSFFKNDVLVSSATYRSTWSGLKKSFINVVVLIFLCFCFFRFMVLGIASDAPHETAEVFFNNRSFLLLFPSLKLSEEVISVKPSEKFANGGGVKKSIDDHMLIKAIRKEGLAKDTYKSDLKKICSGGVSSDNSFKNRSFIGAEFNNVKFCGVDFSGSDLSYASFFKSELSGKFDKSKMFNSQFIDVSFGDGSSFIRAELIATNFKGVELRKGDFSYSIIDKSTLTFVDARLSNFNGTKIKGMNTFESNFNGASFVMASLGAVDFKQTSTVANDLRNFSYYGPDSSLSNHRTDGYSFTYCIIDRKYYLLTREPLSSAFRTCKPVVTFGKDKSSFLSKELNNIERHLINNRRDIVSIASDFGETGVLFLPGFRLTSLAFLRASNRQFVEIDLSRNRLNVDEMVYIDFFQQSVKSLSVSDNMIAYFPADFKKLELLEKLDMSGNLVQSIEFDNEGLGHLWDLNLARNGLVDIVFEVGALENLRILDLSNNNLGMKNISDLGQLTDLRVLNLSSNPLSGLPLELQNLEKIRALSLNNVNMDEIPFVISKMTSLETLSLENNNLTRIPDWLVDLPSLESLQIRGNRLEYPPQIVAESGLSAIRSWLHNNRE